MLQSNRRIALVIGNGDYPDQPLPNVLTDVRRVARTLSQRGFAVTLLENVTANTITAELASMLANSAGSDLSLVYLAGHAVERHGNGYFLPVDFPFPVTPGSARFAAIRLDEFINATVGATGRILVLDACRNWPSAKEERLGLEADLDLLAEGERGWTDVLLAYSTSARRGASDGLTAEGSAFCISFCDHLLTQGIDADECFRRISQDVVRASPTRQQPWTYSSLARSLTFSDLSPFRVLQRHSLPNGHSVSAWCAPDRSKNCIHAGLGGPRAWRVDISGLRTVDYPPGTMLVAAAALNDGLMLAGDNGDLYLTGTGGMPIAALDTGSVFGLCASPDGSGFVHLAKRRATVFRMVEGEPKPIASVKTSFDLYCGAYVSPKVLWVAGGQGRICEIDLSAPRVRTRAVASLGKHINAIAAASGGAVFVVGQASLAVELDRTGTVTRALLNRRVPGTAAGVRAALLGVAEDDAISSYIFNPQTLSAEVKEFFDEELSPVALPSCALAPNLPLLAVGTEESTVIIFDTRDGQLIQELDVATGLPSSVAGLAFLSDNRLVVLSSGGQVTFLAS